MTAKRGARLEPICYMPEENPVKKGYKKDACKNFLNHVKQLQDIDSLPVVTDILFIPKER